MDKLLTKDLQNYVQHIQHKIKTIVSSACPCLLNKPLLCSAQDISDHWGNSHYQLL